MKKAGKILAGTLLGAAFVTAVGFGIDQYYEELKNDSEKESETILQPELKVPEKRTYELGEEVECEGLTWKITNAEVMNYEDLDDYYKTRGNLWQPSEDAVRYGGGMFAEEVQFLVLKGIVKNMSENIDKTYHLSKIEIWNFYENGISSPVSSSYIPVEFEQCIALPPQPNNMGKDGRCISETKGERLIASADDVFIMKPQETLEVEYITAFSEYFGDDFVNYDLYLSTDSLIPDSIYNYSGIKNKIRLDIAPKHLSIVNTDAANCYEEQRDIPKMKCRQWTNSEMKQYQDMGYPVLYEYNNGEIQIADGGEEEVADEEYQFDNQRGMIARITGVKAADWEELPEEFVERGALWDMAECYEQKFGYRREELKILLLDIHISNVGQNMTRYDFYENTYLFTRDENGKRWIFGTADDWLITENSEKNGRVGHMNTELLRQNQVVTCQAAYLLPPEIYNEGELYFCGGGLKSYKFKADEDEEAVIQRVKFQ